MNKKYYQIFIFIIVLFCFDRVVGGLLEYGFYKQPTGPNYQIVHSITSNRSNIVVLGNSRAQHQYNPKIFQQKTGLTFTNSGINGGYGIYLPAFQLEEMSNNYLPKAILIEIDPNALGYWKGNYDRLSVLMPFIDRYPKLSEYVGLRDNFLKLKLFSKSYKYNSLIYNELIYNLFSSKFNHVKSFIPNYKCMTKRDSIAGVNKIRNMSSPTMDINMELIFKKLINMAKSKNIKLIFVNSPIYNNTLNYNYSFAGKKAIQIMNDNNISFWDYSNDTSFFNKYYLFSDRLHLNNKGAELYSNIIADRLVAEGISIKK